MTILLPPRQIQTFGTAAFVAHRVAVTSPSLRRMNTIATACLLGLLSFAMAHDHGDGYPIIRISPAPGAFRSPGALAVRHESGARRDWVCIDLSPLAHTSFLPDEETRTHISVRCMDTRCDARSESGDIVPRMPTPYRRDYIACQETYRQLHAIVHPNGTLVIGFSENTTHVPLMDGTELCTHRRLLATSGHLVTFIITWNK